LLDAQGHPGVIDLQGGFTAWTAAGKPIERGNPAAGGR